MAIQFFGQYLIERKVITPEQLLDAIAYQEATNKLIGEVAIELGYLTYDQVQSVIDEQAITDKEFGGIALDLELLTPEQLIKTIKYQSDTRIIIGEILVNKGYASKENIEMHALQFKISQEKDRELLNLELNHLVNKKDIEIFIESTFKLYQRIFKEQIKISNITSDKAEIINEYVFYQHLKINDKRFIFLFDLPTKVILDITKHMIGIDHCSIDEMSLDCVSEYVNVITGSITTKYSKILKNPEIELLPQQHSKTSEYDFPDLSVVNIGLSCEAGDFMLRVFHSKD